MPTERFGYFRFDKRGNVHYFDQRPGVSGLWSLCGRCADIRRLLPADIEEAERELCKTCKKVQDNLFWGWEQML
jgi:hypothetical protein